MMQKYYESFMPSILDILYRKKRKRDRGWGEKRERERKKGIGQCAKYTTKRKKWKIKFV